MREGIRVREITNDEGKRLLQIVRHSSGSVVRWRRAQGPDRQGRLHLAGPGGSRPAQLQRRRARLVGAQVHRSSTADVHAARATRDQKDRPARPVDHDLPISTWSLTKLAEFLVAEGVVDDISHEGLRVILREGGCLLSSDQDLEAEQRPRLRSQEETGARALRHRRWQGKTEENGTRPS